MWTKFMDMCSGGFKRTKFSLIYIELPEKEAIEYFTKHFQDPEHVTCDCCGRDYSHISSTIEILTKFHCELEHCTMEKHLARSDVKVIRKEDL